MTEPMLAGRWGNRAAALARIAGRTRHGRIASAALAGARATLEATSRVMHLLFLQVTGFVFLVFAVIGGFAAWREYLQYAAGRIGPGRAVLAGCFGAMFLWFGVSSFWRAQKKK